MKISNQTLYNINKNEYQAQQESKLEDATNIGLTEDDQDQNILLRAIHYIQ